jgi:hypothetical protein
MVRLADLLGADDPETFAAWPGSGLRLWAFPVPVGTLQSAASRAVLGYDAAGRVVWQQNFPAAGR